MVITIFLFQFSLCLLQIHWHYSLNKSSRGLNDSLLFALVKSQDRMQTADLIAPDGFSIFNFVWTLAGKTKTIFILSLKHKRVQMQAQGIKPKRNVAWKVLWQNHPSMRALSLPKSLHSTKLEAARQHCLPGNSKVALLSKAAPLPSDCRLGKNCPKLV